MGRKSKDISCQKFGRLIALYRLHNYHKKDGVYWLCVCECGNLCEVKSGNLIHNNTKSCGCWLKKNAQLKFTTHGKRNTRLYRTWAHIKSRCYNNNVPAYNDYGGREILGLNYHNIQSRLHYGWSIEQSLELEGKP